MQIKAHRNTSSTHQICKNDVQKVSATTDSSKNEGHCERLDVVSRKYMYFEVSSSLYEVNLHQNHNWSLLPLKKIISYMLAPSFLGQKRFYIVLSKCFHDVWIERISTLSYRVWQLNDKSNFQWSEYSHKSLTISRYFVVCLSLQSSKNKTTLSTHYHKSSMTSFYTNPCEVLLNSICDYCNKETINYNIIWNQQQESKYDRIFMFRDLSTNNKTCEMFFITNELYGIENSYHRRLTNVRHQKLNFIHGILLIKLHVMCCCTCYEISDHIVRYVEHWILLQLVAHNQIIFHDVKVSWHHQRHQYEMKIQLTDDKSCREIENGTSSLATTSNHKLKPIAQNDNDTCHQENEKFSKCYQQFHRTFRSNDSVKSHLNAILFLIILCIPLLTSASGVHNLKYSTNIVKTKYGE